MEPVTDKKSWVEKLRELPEEHKKAVLILVVAICAVAILPLEIFLTVGNVHKLSQSVSSINLPAFSVPSSSPLLPDLNALDATPDASEDNTQLDASTPNGSPAPDLSPQVSPDVSPTPTPQQFWGGQ